MKFITLVYGVTYVTIVSTSGLLKLFIIILPFKIGKVTSMKTKIADFGKEDDVRPRCLSS